MILIFRHVDCEGPGYLLDVLESNNLDYQMINIDQSEVVPDELSDVSGLVFMGGGMSVNDNLGWIGDELRLIKEAYNRDIPVFGHCLGAQLMAKALGAEITPNPVTEIGWFDVQRIDSDVSENYPADFTAFHWHGETFSLPENARPLYTNKHCIHQGFEYDKSIALQFHIEMKHAMVKDWSERFADQLAIEHESIQGMHDITDKLDIRIEQLHHAADHIYLHWLQNVNQ